MIKTPKEFKEARLRLGLTVSELGDILNVSADTIRKWEGNPDSKRSRDPNPIACRVLEWFAEYPEFFAKIKRKLK